MNSYEQLHLMRDYVNEPVMSHWSEATLLFCLNLAQARIAQHLYQQPGGWLMAHVNVTPVDSVITLPNDCAKPVYLEEVTSGRQVAFSTEVMDRRVSRMPGTTLWTGAVEVYPEGKVLVVNKDSYTEQCTLWYQYRVPDLHVGTAQAGGALSITLDTHDGSGGTSGLGAKAIADYYNNSKLQIVSGTGAGDQDTISDYTAARVATVTGTYGADSVYGTVSRLPEQSHMLMTLEGVLIALAKPGAAVDPKYFEYTKDRYTEYRNLWSDWVTTYVVNSQHTRVTELE